jgi:hypothetical protein
MPYPSKKCGIRTFRTSNPRLLLGLYSPRVHRLMTALLTAASVFASAELADVHGASFQAVAGFAVVVAGLASWFSTAPGVEILRFKLRCEIMRASLIKKNY